MATALYGPSGFFVRAGGAGPGDHFRTSVHASPAFASAVLRLVSTVDEALDRPARLDVVDVGAGRGELLVALDALAPAGLRERLALTAVEVSPRPDALAPSVTWRPTVPPGVVGLLVATEWLDNVPVDVAVDDRYVTVSAGGDEAVDGPVDGPDRDWLDRWWPSGPRREVGRSRDLAWAGAVGAVARGLAVAVDYGHVRETRPVDGSLTGFRAGRQVAPVPDGSCDVTAHVAMDAVAAAPGLPYRLISQREALRALGVDGARPPLAMASTDPAGYVRALSRASAAAELTDPAGLGGHWWLLQPVGLDLQSVTRWTGSPVTREIAS
jgi:SAM-dependent MidA family methyltransferase